MLSEILSWSVVVPFLDTWLPLPLLTISLAKSTRQMLKSVTSSQILLPVEQSKRPQERSENSESEPAD
ncbi:hypothetical protein N7453_003400 [Penicillium expansum]|nr:hypothetical protein N7453_003400 [Penicillium expansum]